MEFKRFVWTTDTAHLAITCAASAEEIQMVKLLKTNSLQYINCIHAFHRSHTSSLVHLASIEQHPLGAVE